MTDDEQVATGDVPGGLPELLKSRGYTGPSELSRAAGKGPDGKPRLLVQGAFNYLGAGPEAYNAFPRSMKTITGLSIACGEPDDVAVLLAFGRSLGLRIPLILGGTEGSLTLTKIRRAAAVLDRHPQVAIDLGRLADSIADTLTDRHDGA